MAAKPQFPKSSRVPQSTKRPHYDHYIIGTMNGLAVFVALVYISPETAATATKTLPLGPEGGIDLGETVSHPLTCAWLEEPILVLYCQSRRDERPGDTRGTRLFLNASDPSFFRTQETFHVRPCIIIIFLIISHDLLYLGP